MEIVRAELLKEDSGHYTQYIFRDLSNGKFLLCTKLPNWDANHINLGDIGFLKYKEVVAWDTKYKDPRTGREQAYRYDGCYFDYFTKEVAERITDTITL